MDTLKNEGSFSLKNVFTFSKTVAGMASVQKWVKKGKNERGEKREEHVFSLSEILHCLLLIEESFLPMHVPNSFTLYELTAEWVVG